MPDFSRVATVEITRSGRWSELFASTPLMPHDVVRIPKGIQVDFDAADPPRFRALVLAGGLRFAPELATRLTVGTLQIVSGRLEIKPTTGRAELRFHGELDLLNDPGQYSIGLLARGGEISLRGSAPQLIHARLAHPTEPGVRVIDLSAAPDWRPGDQVIISGARFVRSDPAENKIAVESEFVEIESIEGNRVTLKTPLEFAHDEGVSHLSRQIRITSAEDSPVFGHLLFSARAKVSVEGVEFQRLGRTLTTRLNDTRWRPDGTAASTGTQQRGRYVLHAHHLIEPIRIANCVVFDRSTNRWAITLHASHGVVERNVVVFPGGAGIVAENGFETGIIRNNVLIGGLGGGDSLSDLERGSLRGSDGRNMEDRGWEGHGLWLRSPTFEVTGNLVEGAFRESAFGFHCFEPDGEREVTTFPSDPGRPRQVAGKTLNDVWCRLRGIQVFSQNTNHAFIAHEPSSGAALYLAHMFLTSPFVVDNFTSKNSGKVLAYYSRNFEFAGLNLTGIVDRNEKSPGIFMVGVSEVVLRDSQIRNCSIGLTPPLIDLVVTNCLFENRVNMVFQPGDADCTCHTSFQGRTHTLSRVRFGPNSLTNIWMHAGDLPATKEVDEEGSPNPRALAKMLSHQTRVVVRDYDGVSGDDFEVFFSEQSPTYVLPGLGVSNQDLFDGRAPGELAARLRGRSFNDRIARDAQTREKISGLVSPIDSAVLIYADRLGTEQMDSPAGVQTLTYNLGGRLTSSTAIVGGKNYRASVNVKPGLNFLVQDIPGLGPYTFLILGQTTQ